MPTEIHRAVRDLDTLHFWKGTEFRTFLLYLGNIVLKNVVELDEYNHFRLLSCAVILCSSDVYKRVVDNTVLVDRLLGDYIEEYIHLYGEQTISSNVHNLCHLLDDIRRFGNLNTISAYPFESYLGLMKNKLRAMKKPLQQLSHRMTEITDVITFETDFRYDAQYSPAAELKYPARGDRTKFQSVFFRDFRLSSLKFGDKWFMDKKERIIKFSYATQSDTEILLHGCEVKGKTNFFSQPISSSLLHIYSAKHIEDEECNKTTSKIE